MVSNGLAKLLLRGKSLVDLIVGYSNLGLLNQLEAAIGKAT